MASIQSLGAGSGLDLDNIVKQLVAAERQPVELRLARSEARFQSQLSAMGTIKGALSALRDSAQALSSGSGLNARTVTSSNPDVFSGTAAAGTATGSFDIEVLSLATANKVASDPFADPDAQIGTGTVTLSVGGNAFSLNIDAGDGSLASIRDAINAAPDNTGISAAILNEDAGSRLVLTSRDTGAANTIGVSASGGDGGLTALAPLTQLRAASDASLTVDTFAFSSPSNNVEGVIEGLTLNLDKASPGTVETLAVSENRAAAVGRVRDFVDKLNTFNEAASRAASYNAETREAGPLLGDATLRGIDSRIQQITGSQVRSAQSAFNSLPALGITTNEAGKLVLDEGRLNQALEAEPGALTRVLAGDDGVATALGGYLDGVLGFDSLIASREEGLKNSLDGIGEQRVALDRRIAGIEARFVAEFAALDGLVASLSQTGDFLQQQLANLPGTVNNNRR